ncbi:MAG: NAD-dependent epimerase/dehydratase family protein [Chloroflexi bacterium]|nr:MAG: NAD-dependent epimerase/dehydratase family protein [Chloroflexota bacterium]MBL1195305.1 SDR family oxidoreductase [Chloroflexota bacterium]NOH12589.1 SDR family oxidoreductase [Chloroflexota bacterium]
MTLSLVTGGAGFIGSHLATALVEQGQSVRVLDNFSTGNVDNLAHLQDQVEVIEDDLRDAGKVLESVSGVDYIFHHAAFISVPQSMLEPQNCFDINVVGTANILEAARQHNVQAVVLASSAAVYGDNENMPLTEDSETRSLSPYAASKRMNEIQADLYTQAYDLPVVSLRYFNVYGPRQAPDSPYAAAIPIFAHRMLSGETPTVFGDGGQSRDFVYVQDVVRANLAASQSPHAAGRALNVCTGQEVKLLDLLDMLTELIPNAPEPEFGEPRPGDIYRSLGNASLAKQLLDFSPQTSLVDGLSQTVEWMRS